MDIKPTATSGYVRGHTLIDHKRRNKLNLSLAEYVFLDAVEQLIVREDKFNAVTMQNELYKICGVQPNTYKVLGAALRKKGFLVSEGNNLFVLDDRWKDGSANYEKEFEEMWTLLQKVGNRKKGLTMYIKARKAGFEYDFLLKRVKIYRKFVEDSEQYPLHVSSFFNPANEEFNNEFKVINKKTKGGNNETTNVYDGKF